MSNAIFGEPTLSFVESGEVQSDVDPHFALIYESQREQFATTVPFIRTGIEEGDRCLYCYHDNDRDELLADVEQDGIVEERPVKLETLAGDVRWMEITLALVEKSGDRYLDGIVRDIAEQAIDQPGS